MARRQSKPSPQDQYWRICPAIYSVVRTGMTRANMAATETGFDVLRSTNMAAK
jgi:hypothetical protein